MVLSLCATIILLLTNTRSKAFGAGPPDLTVTPKSQITFVGGSATFECKDSATSLPADEVHWVCTFGELPEYENTLTMDNVTVDDEMSYYCLKQGFSYSSPGSDNTGELHVYEYPEILSCPASVTFSVGESPEISCQVKLGRPPANLTWYEGDAIISVKVTNGSCNDGWCWTSSGGVKWAGGYTSTKLTLRLSYLLSSPYEKVIERTINVTVGEGPVAYNSTQDSEQPKLITGFYDEEVTLDCSAQKGYPPPEYTWFLVNDSAQETPFYEPISWTSSVLTLNVTDDSMHANGSLHCLCNLTNEFGSDAVHFLVTLKPAPTQSSLQVMSSHNLANTKSVYGPQISPENAETNNNHYSVGLTKGVVSTTTAQVSPSTEVIETTSDSDSFNLVPILQLVGICLVAILVMILIVVVMVVFRCWYSHRTRFATKQCFQDVWLPDQDFQLEKNSLYMETSGLKPVKLDKVQALQPGTGSRITKDSVEFKSRSRSLLSLFGRPRPIPAVWENVCYDTIASCKSSKAADALNRKIPTEKAKEMEKHVYDEAHIYEKL